MRYYYRGHFMKQAYKVLVTRQKQRANLILEKNNDLEQSNFLKSCLLKKYLTSTELTWHQTPANEDILCEVKFGKDAQFFQKNFRN